MMKRMKTALWWLRVAKMNKRILCLIILFVFILTPHLSSKGEFDNILIEKLNDDKYIVPGLGDAGDRLFGTK